MSCLGVHFAIPSGTGGALWDGDDAARAFVERLEAAWDTDHLQETDKAWDPIHRCLTDGTVGWCPEAWPLNGAILGDDPLYKGDDYIVQHLFANEVVEVADGLDRVTQEWFRERFLALAERGYDGAVDEAAFDYVWYWFERLRAFFRRSADEGRETVFTADQ